MPDGNDTLCMDPYTSPHAGRWTDMRTLLIVLGLTFLALGLAWPWLSKLPLGRLPGDIVIERPDLKFYFPLATMILVSAILSFLLWLFRR